MSPRKSVLVVDDDWDVLEAVLDTLASEGYETVGAQDGLTALDYLRTRPPPGLVLLDWNMAPMNGAAFMAELARDPQLAAIPVVLVTADVRLEAKARGTRFAGCLKKPVELDALFATVARFCERRA